MREELLVLASIFTGNHYHLPVGGIKEKVLAAHYAGITVIVLPKRNEKDLEEVPEEIRRKTNFIFVEDLGEVFALSMVDANLRRAA